MRIIIYEDKIKYLQSLTLLIDGTDGYSVVGSFPNCKNVEKEISTLKPDIVLMDIEMPEVNGIEGVIKIKEKDVTIKVVMYTVFDDNDKLFACLKAGANGYLLKKTAPAKLLDALKDVYTGGAPMSPPIARRVLEAFHKLSSAPNEYRLTKREKQVLELLVEGYTYKGIAAELHISIETVTTHLQNIYKKLHVNCATQAVVKAIREGLI